MTLWQGRETGVAAGRPHGCSFVTLCASTRLKQDEGDGISAPSAGRVRSHSSPLVAVVAECSSLALAASAALVLVLVLTGLEGAGVVTKAFRRGVGRDAPRLLVLALDSVLIA
ncbi:hypothetical protein OHB05_42225, partial [Streptomyces sp. NBC_00638]|uniref:hypothetical protein n=1 Tax=Streptomyces sp. NBC_00638 TaxID=2975794 RepID=UPI002256BDFE